MQSYFDELGLHYCCYAHLHCTLLPLPWFALRFLRNVVCFADVLNVHYSFLSIEGNLTVICLFLLGYCCNTKPSACFDSAD